MNEADKMFLARDFTDHLRRMLEKHDVVLGLRREPNSFISSLNDHERAILFDDLQGLAEEFIAAAEVRR